MCLTTAACAPVAAAMCYPVTYAVHSAQCRLKHDKVHSQPSEFAVFVQVEDAVDCLFILQVSKRTE